MDNKEKRTITIDDSKKISIEILSYVDEWCRENKVNYYLGFGTLLGAVRHGGMIPWDDDVDLFMKRSDYNKFISEFNTKCCKNKYCCISFENGTFQLPYAKVVDLETRMEDQSVCKSGNLGIGIDIFPIDSISLKQNSKFYKTKILFLKKMIRYSLYINELEFENDKLKYIKILFYRFSKALGYEFWKNKLLKTLGNCNKRGDELYMCIEDNINIYEKSWFEGEEKLNFEFCLYPVPYKYEEVLKTMYGDYMKLPPEDQRIGHCQKAFYI